MRFEPGPGKVVIRPDTPEAQTKAGLVLPSAAQEVPYTGVVVSVGADGMTEYGAQVPQQFKPGDHVAFPQWAGGSTITLNGEKLVVANIQDITGWLLDDDK